MNRRSFLARVGVAAAVVPVLEACQPSDPPPHKRPDPPVPDGLRGAVESAEAGSALVQQVAELPFYNDWLALRTRRNLLLPCPNCAVASWRRVAHGVLECAGCGWRDQQSRLVARCRCTECTADVFGGKFHERRDATREYVAADAEPGLYRLVDDRGQPHERRVLNGYDVSTDRVVHHVIEQQFARVACAVRALDGPNYREPHGYEQRRQPNGNLILIGWTMVDCFEWQVDRGEKPPITYHADADGRVRLVQGVQS